MASPKSASTPAAAATAANPGPAVVDSGARNGTASRFHGLSDTAKICIVAAATLMAVTSLIWGAVSWTTVNKDMRFNGEDYAELAGFYESIKSGTNHDTYLMTHALDLHVQMQRITNDQGLKSLAISLSVALIAVGFALFLLGADGTFSLAAEDKSGPSVTVQGTAPGLLCFALAAMVMAMVIMTRAKLEIKPGELPSPPLPLPQNVDEARLVYSIWSGSQAWARRPEAIPLPDSYRTAEHSTSDAAERIDDVLQINFEGN